MQEVCFYSSGEPPFQFTKVVITGNGKSQSSAVAIVDQHLLNVFKYIMIDLFDCYQRFCVFQPNLGSANAQ